MNWDLVWLKVRYMEQFGATHSWTPVTAQPNHRFTPPVRCLLPVVLMALAGAGCGEDDLCPMRARAEEGRLAGIVVAHNAVRKRISDPEPTPALPPMRWSESLAATAQCYAHDLASRDCSLVHSASPYGENLAWFSGREPTAEDVVEAWASERSCYSFGAFMDTDACSSECDRSGGCGHYTQIAWRDSTEVGCGYATCEDGAGEVWVCNYDPPGNFVGDLPY